MHAFDMLADPVRRRICRRGRTYLKSYAGPAGFGSNAPARLLLVRQLTVEQAKELADTTVKNSGHLCSSARRNCVRLLVAT